MQRASRRNNVKEHDPITLWQCHALSNHVGDANSQVGLPNWISMNDTVLLIYANVGFCFWIKSIHVAEANSTLTKFPFFLSLSSCHVSLLLSQNRNLNKIDLSPPYLQFRRLSNLETMQLDEVQPWRIGDYVKK